MDTAGLNSNLFFFFLPSDSVSYLSFFLLIADAQDIKFVSRFQMLPAWEGLGDVSAFQSANIQTLQPVKTLWQGGKWETNRASSASFPPQSFSLFLHRTAKGIGESIKGTHNRERQQAFLVLRLMVSYCMRMTLWTLLNFPLPPSLPCLPSSPSPSLSLSSLWLIAILRAIWCITRGSLGGNPRGSCTESI